MNYAHAFLKVAIYFHLIKASVESFVQNEVDWVCSEEIIPEEWNLSLLVENLSKVLPADGLASITETLDKTRIKAIVSEESASLLREAG